MPLHNIEDHVLRVQCRNIIENLERWLRRLIDDELSGAHGADYINATNHKGGAIISKRIQDKLTNRKKHNPQKFPRLVDAAELDDLIYLICHPMFYNRHFKKALECAFPDGEAEARTFLNRLIEPRNSLSHAIDISVRQAEQVVCYSNDITDALKTYYRTLGMEREYDAPTIIKLVDNFGHAAYDKDMRRGGTASQGGVDRRMDANATLRPGDRLSIEATIDPSFEDSGYSVWWSYLTTTCGPGKKVVVDIKEEHVRPVFQITCNVRSNKKWHRLGSLDDYVTMIYKVLQPLPPL